MYGISVVSVRSDLTGKTIMKTQMGSYMLSTQLTIWDSKNVQKNSIHFLPKKTLKVCLFLFTPTSKISSSRWMLLKLWKLWNYQKLLTELGTCKLALLWKRKDFLKAWNGSLRQLATRNEPIILLLLAL